MTVAGSIPTRGSSLVFFPRSDNNKKRGVEFCHSADTHSINISGIQRDSLKKQNIIKQEKNAENVFELFFLSYHA